MTALFTSEEGDIELTRLPLERHASLEAGLSHEEILAATITRPEARVLAAALLAYAETPDPGPGAPYPMTEEFAREVERWSGSDSIPWDALYPTPSWHGMLVSLVDAYSPKPA